MHRRDGPTLAERAGAPPAPPPAAASEEPEPRAPVRVVVRRHCWVQGLPEAAGPLPGLLVEWRQSPSPGDGRRWQGRVVYVVPDREGTGPLLLEAWLDAEHLTPA